MTPLIIVLSMIRLGPLRCGASGLVDELDFRTAYQLLDVNHDDHPVIERGEPLYVLRVQRSAEFRRRFDALVGERYDVGHAVHHDPDGALQNAENDHRRVVTIFDVFQAELDAQIDDRNDVAAQIDHALDEVGRIRDPRHGVVAADFPYLENVDTVFFASEGKRKKFALLSRCRRAIRFVLHLDPLCPFEASGIAGPFHSLTRFKIPSILRRRRTVAHSLGLNLLARRRACSSPTGPWELRWVPARS